MTLFTWFSEVNGMSFLLQTQHKLFSTLDWLVLTVIPSPILQSLDVEMFSRRVVEGCVMPEEDHLFYSILFRCGIYKGSEIGSEGKANILLNWRPPQHRQLQLSLSSFSLPVSLKHDLVLGPPSMRSKGDFPSACSTCHFTFTLPVDWVASLWDRNEFWPPLVEPWMTPGEDKGAMKVKIDLREPAKPQRYILVMVSWSIQGSGWSKLFLISWQFFTFSSLRDCLLSWERILEIWGRQLLREGSCLVPISAWLFSYRALSFSHHLSCFPTDCGAVKGRFSALEPLFLSCEGNNVFRIFLELNFKTSWFAERNKFWSDIVWSKVTVLPYSKLRCFTSVRSVNPKSFALTAFNPNISLELYFSLAALIQELDIYIRGQDIAAITSHRVWSPLHIVADVVL